ncbi:MAG TPA: hypothetical protein DDW52_05325 [Planctomycetaceae bacterium]|nr:hypothetical protein [Planctomycetaceae bacterium]
MLTWLVDSSSNRNAGASAWERRYVTVRCLPHVLATDLIAMASKASIAVLGLLFCIGWPAQVSAFQDIVREEPELIDQEPFDLIVLTADAGGGSEKVFPLPFPGRKVPVNPRETDRLDVVLVRFPEREYEVMWRDIEKIELYENRIYKQAVDRMADKDFIGAFQNLSFLMKKYPRMDRLATLQKEFLLQSALDSFTATGDVAQTLSALEELRKIDRSYRASSVTNGLSRAADRIVQKYQSSGDLTNAKAILSRLSREYGSDLPVVQQWQTRLESMARARLQEARQLVEAGKFREARRAAVDMLGILPSYEPGKELIKEINQTHPMVRVGVMQKSSSPDPAALVRWPDRRTGGLLARPLVKFEAVSTEGGVYDFALGRYSESDDRQSLLLDIDPNNETPLDAFALAQSLGERGDPGHELYDASWAAILKSVRVLSERQVLIQLRRPNILPWALMQWMLVDEDSGEYLLAGPYLRASEDELESSFKLRPEYRQPGRPIEIVEVFYEDPKRAVNDLMRGEIDVLDQLYPADARRLASEPQLRVGAYALPTNHMLIPVSDDPYLQNPKFRRAMLYGCNREAMLRGELLSSDDPNEGQVVSGPFPLGIEGNDTLAYAYDESIEPIAHSPPLARLLSVMAVEEVTKSFNRKRKPVPPLESLVVGCPDFEFARVAVEGMIQQWSSVGIQAELKVMPPSEVLQRKDEVDLIYVMANMWEPATDIERLLGSSGVVVSDNPYIVQGLVKLRAARNWPEVTRALKGLHQLVDYHLPILPLWQVTDRFAVRKTVNGIEGSPVSLYQDVLKWEVDLGIDQ